MTVAKMAQGGNPVAKEEVRRASPPPPPPSTTTTAADSATLDEACHSDSSTPFDLENPTIADMAPGGRGRPNRPKREIDLTVLIDSDQKGQLMTLVETIVTKMEKELGDGFKYLQLPIAQTQPRIKIWNYPGQKTADSQPGDINGDKPKTHGTINVDEIPATNPSMSQLHIEVRATFSKWRSVLYQRLAEIVVQTPTATAQRQGQSSSRGAGAGPNAASKPYGTKGKDVARTKTFEYPVDAYLVKYFPTTKTPLSTLPVDKRRLLLHAMILLVLSLEHYSSYSRRLLMNLASSLHLPLYVLVGDEKRIAYNLALVHENMLAEEALQHKTEENKENKPPKKSRNSSLTTAAATGAALVAGGIGSVPGGIGLGAVTTAALLGAVAENEVSLGALFGASVTKPPSKSLESFSGAIQDFGFMPLHDTDRTEYRDANAIQAGDRRMRLVICVNGFQSDKDDVLGSWSSLGTQNEVFVLRWEVETLYKMGGALEIMPKSAAWALAKKELDGRTIMATINQKAWPHSLMTVSKIIDNPWTVAIVRADKAGMVLAEAILNKVQGERGVSLIGYGLGARVIWQCLVVLAERRAFAFIDSVVLMGCPCPSEAGTWSALKSVVSGRLVNVYSQSDYILGFAHRMGCFQYGVAGLQRVDGVGGVENADMSDLVSAHFEYQSVAGEILTRIGWEDLASAQPPPRVEPAAVQMPATAPRGVAKENTVPPPGGGRNRRKPNEKQLAAQMENMRLR